MLECAIGEREFEEFGVKRLVFVVGSAIHGKDEGFAVGSPGEVGGGELRDSGTVREFAGGELTRCAAFGGDDEDLGVTRFEVAGAVEAVDEVLVDFWRIGPFGAFGSGRESGDLRRSGGNEGMKSDLLAIG